MGKGDLKSKRGKIHRGTSGVRRRKKKKIAEVAVVAKPKAIPKKKAIAKKSVEKKATFMDSLDSPGRLTCLRRTRFP